MPPKTIRSSTTIADPLPIDPDTVPSIVVDQKSTPKAKPSNTKSLINDYIIENERKLKYIYPNLYLVGGFILQLLMLIVIGIIVTYELPNIFLVICVPICFVFGVVNLYFGKEYERVYRLKRLFILLNNEMRLYRLVCGDVQTQLKVLNNISKLLYDIDVFPLEVCSRDVMKVFDV